MSHAFAAAWLPRQSGETPAGYLAMAIDPEDLSEEGESEEEVGVVEEEENEEVEEDEEVEEEIVEEPAEE